MKDINFFAGSISAANSRRVPALIVGGLVVLGFCIVAVGTAFGWLTLQVRAADAQIAQINAEIESIRARHEGLDTLNDRQTELAFVRSYTRVLTEFDAAVKTFPRLDAAFLQDLAARLPAEVTVASFDYDNGLLTLDCRTLEPLAPAEMAAALKGSPYLEDVEYHGYVFNNEEQTLEDGTILTTPVFEFTIECVLKGGQES